MLRNLSIRDIVLIDRLDLELGSGLSALTGETGAGKSIVLDALGLALGDRGDRGLVRAGAAQGSVTADFDVPPDHPAHRLLDENGLPGDGEIVVRRSVGADGRSRSFVNDTAIGTGLLRQLGDALVEVHGQHDQRGLLDVRQHGILLDAFGGLGDLVARCRAAHEARGVARTHLAALTHQLEAARHEEDYLRHRERELADLAAEPGEEETLARRRQELQHRDKLVEALNEAAIAAAGAVERLGTAQRRLDRVAGLTSGGLAEPLAALERALVEAGEAEAAVEAVSRDLGGEGAGIETVEERLFGLRDAARKHRVPVDGLSALLDETRRLLEEIDAGCDGLRAADLAVAQTDADYADAARILSAARAEAARGLAEAVAAELPALRLERARFRVALATVPPDEAGPDGIDRVRFEIRTNPGQPFADLARIASGGELSRLMLALKVVLARLDHATTLIFDEVDAGIGGATADAVGERLARLGGERQVLVVTHAPQVAARADHHLSVTKHADGRTTRIEVTALEPERRRDELARMLAGAEITDAARAAAASLMRTGTDG